MASKHNCFFASLKQTIKATITGPPNAWPTNSNYKIPSRVVESPQKTILKEVYEQLKGEVLHNKSYFMCLHQTGRASGR